MEHRRASAAAYISRAPRSGSSRRRVSHITHNKQHEIVAVAVSGLARCTSFGSDDGSRPSRWHHHGRCCISPFPPLPAATDRCAPRGLPPHSSGRGTSAGGSGYRAVVVDHRRGTTVPRRYCCRRTCHLDATSDERARPVRGDRAV